MNLYRQEIRDLIRLGETLLSPVCLEQPLTQEERLVVGYYARELAGRYASRGHTLVEQTELAMNGF